MMDIKCYLKYFQKLNQVIICVWMNYFYSDQEFVEVYWKNHLMKYLVNQKLLPVFLKSRVLKIKIHMVLFTS